MTFESGASSQLDIVRVIQRSWDTAKIDFGAKFAAAALLAGLPSAAVNYSEPTIVTESDLNRYLFPLAPAILVAVAAALVLHAALIRSAMAQMEGRPSNLGDNLAAGLRLFLPFIGLSILASLAITCGLILLVVPGVILACAWSVAVPALVEENTGVFGAFRRSAELTRGNRWRIFGLAWAYIGIVLIVAIPIGILIGIVALPLGMFGGGLAVAAGLNGLFSAAIAVVAATAAAVLFDELRNRPPRSAVQEIVDILR